MLSCTLGAHRIKQFTILVINHIQTFCFVSLVPTNPPYCFFPLSNIFLKSSFDLGAPVSAALVATARGMKGAVRTATKQGSDGAVHHSQLALKINECMIKQGQLKPDLSTPDLGQLAGTSSV